MDTRFKPPQTQDQTKSKNLLREHRLDSYNPRKRFNEHMKAGRYFEAALLAQNFIPVSGQNQQKGDNNPITPDESKFVVKVGSNRMTLAEVKLALKDGGDPITLADLKLAAIYAFATKLAEPAPPRDDALPLAYHFRLDLEERRIGSFLAAKFALVKGYPDSERYAEDLLSKNGFDEQERIRLYYEAFELCLLSGKPKRAIVLVNKIFIPKDRERDLAVECFIELLVDGKYKKAKRIEKAYGFDEKEAALYATYACDECVEKKRHRRIDRILELYPTIKSLISPDAESG